jgi:hypothetical protein
MVNKRKQAKKKVLRAKRRIAKSAKRATTNYEVSSTGQGLDSASEKTKGTSGTGPRLCGDNDDET